MKAIKLTEEQKEKMSYTDVAYLVLTENGKKMQIQELFKTVIKLLDLPDSYFESKIADFFGLLSTDKRFAMIEKGFWDLKINHSAKIVLDEEEDDDDELEVEEEIEDENESNEDEEINYDDDSIEDDEEDDDLKDLVVIDESEELEM